jgi:hypothetical protein
MDWCGLEGLHCDVVITQTNDIWGHIAGHAMMIHFCLIVGSAQCRGVKSMPSVDCVIISQ